MSESVPDTSDFLDFTNNMEDENVPSSTVGFDEPAKDEEPSPESEKVPDEKEETSAVEDLPTEKTESEEKPEETPSKGKLNVQTIVSCAGVLHITSAVNSFVCGLHFDCRVDHLIS